MPRPTLEAAATPARAAAALLRLLVLLGITVSWGGEAALLRGREEEATALATQGGVLRIPLARVAIPGGDSSRRRRGRRALLAEPEEDASATTGG